jgi:hypothetical protein
MQQEAMGWFTENEGVVNKSNPFFFVIHHCAHINIVPSSSM